jgi:hypothetical protein
VVGTRYHINSTEVDLDKLGFVDKAKENEIPAFLSSEPHNEDLNYSSVIGKMNYLENSARPEIAYVVHQCARFASQPRMEHIKAVKQIGQYLLGTKNKGIHIQPNKESIHCLADADFLGNWDP